MIDRNEAVAKRIEDANAETAKLIERAAELKLRETLGGKADAGQGQVEETDGDYAKKVMANDIDTKQDS